MNPMRRIVRIVDFRHAETKMNNSSFFAPHFDRILECYNVTLRRLLPVRGIST